MLFDRDSLLRYDYIPAELPPCFCSNSLADFWSDSIKTAQSFGRSDSIPLLFSGYKTDTARRQFGIPNPYHYCLAVDYIVDHEASINEVLRRSNYSLTAPITKKKNESVAYGKLTHSVLDTKKLIEKEYQNNRYELRLDINAFFSSIYTHTIPWAIHGIAASKKDSRKKALWGSQLDFRIQSLNYKQTNGILTGNAISRIISEIILCTVDGALKKAFPNIKCCRYVDDYYIYLNDASQIQPIISKLRSELSLYQLSLNENKLVINESPFQYGKPWIEQLYLYTRSTADVFLSKLITEYRTHKDIAVFKYGLKILYSYCYTKENWTIMQSKFINLLASFPSLASYLLPIFYSNQSNLSKTQLKSALYSIIDQSLSLAQDEELIWAIWYAKVFEIQFSKKYISKVLHSNNDLAVIILLDMVSHRGFLGDPIIRKDITALKEKLEEADVDESKAGELMWSSHWLLAYECERNKWLHSSGNTFAYASKNQFFKRLIENHVYFYDNQFKYDLDNTKQNSNNRKPKPIEKSEKLSMQLSELKKQINSKEEKDNQPEQINKELLSDFISVIESSINTY